MLPCYQNWNSVYVQPDESANILKNAAWTADVELQGNTWLRTNVSGRGDESVFMGWCIAMAILLNNVTNSIWHAFTALCSDKNGNVMKSKLKVNAYSFQNIII